MEVILLQKVANLGNIGDRVKVRSGFGRNFLLPQGKATLATPDNVARFEARRAELERLAREHMTSAEDRAVAMKGSCSARAARPTSPRPLPRPASRWSAARCACPADRCA